MRQRRGWTHREAKASRASATYAGVGTELKKLIAAANLKSNKGCGCDGLAAKMNAWGVAGCRARRAEIVAKLQKNAREAGLEAVADFADAALDAAIEAVCQRDRGAVDGFLATLPSCPPCEHRGIVTCAGGETLELHAYVLFRLLRALGCTLPIQCYYSGATEHNPRFGELIAGLGVEYIDAVAMGYRPHAQIVPVKFRGVNAYKPGWVNGYTLKAWVIANCPFQHVAWIDADSHVCRDPNELFDTEEYRQHRALLWQEPGDAGHAPDWSSLGIELPAERHRGLESGQLFVDKQEHWKALALASWFCENAAHWFQYTWGDKDAFLAAFLYTNSRHWLAPHPKWRTGVAIIQPAIDGEPMFYHRAGQGAKLRPGEPDRLTEHPLRDVIVSAVKDFPRFDTTSVPTWEERARAQYAESKGVVKRLRVLSAGEAQEQRDWGRVVTVADDAPFVGDSHHLLDDFAVCGDEPIANAIRDAAASLANGQTIVNCKGGLNRSATVASAAIALLEGIPLTVAVKIVRRIRPQMNPLGVMLDAAERCLVRLREEFQPVEGDRLLLHLHDGIDLWVDPHEDRLVTEFRRRGHWEAFVVRAMRRFVKPGMTVANIGANFGYHTLILSKLVGPMGRVIAVEPNQRMLDYLLRNVAGYRNVTVAPVALSDFEGTATLTFPQNDPCLASIVLEGYAVNEQVEVTTLDRLAMDLMVGTVDFALIDAEGSEPAIFRGGAETLGRSNTTLCVEYAGERYSDEEAYTKFLEQAYPLRKLGFDSYPRVTTPAELMRNRKAVHMLWLQPR